MSKTARGARRLPKILFACGERHCHELSEYCTSDCSVYITKGGREYEGNVSEWGPCGTSQSAYIEAFLRAATQARLSVSDRLRDPKTEVVYEILSLNANGAQWLVFVPEELRARLAAVDYACNTPGGPHYHNREKTKCLLAVVGWGKLRIRRVIPRDPNWKKRIRQAIARDRKRLAVLKTRWGKNTKRHEVRVLKNRIHELQQDLRSRTRSHYSDTPLSQGLIP